MGHGHSGQATATKDATMSSMSLVSDVVVVVVDDGLTIADASPPTTATAFTFQEPNVEERQTDRQTDRRTDRRTDRQTKEKRAPRSLAFRHDGNGRITDSQSKKKRKISKYIFSLKTKSPSS